jgi:hypothetical protein
MSDAIIPDGRIQVKSDGISQDQLFPALPDPGKYLLYNVLADIGALYKGESIVAKGTVIVRKYSLKPFIIAFLRNVHS